MAARVTQIIVETIRARPTYSPTTPTGAGVTQIIMETIERNSAAAVRISQIVVETIERDVADGSHGAITTRETSSVFGG